MLEIGWRDFMLIRGRRKNLTKRTLVMDQDFIDLLEWIKTKSNRRDHGEVIQTSVKLLALIIEEEEKGNSILDRLKFKADKKSGNVLPFRPRK